MRRCATITIGDVMKKKISVCENSMVLVYILAMSGGFMDAYSYMCRGLYVRPGLTCIWQIQPNRNDVTFDEWMDMDMRYIRDRSFPLDWKLIFGTVWTVFAGTGE